MGCLRTRMVARLDTLPRPSRGHMRSPGSQSSAPGPPDLGVSIDLGILLSRNIGNRVLESTDLDSFGPFRHRTGPIGTPFRPQTSQTLP